ncbi:ligand-binding sensor domain-containing protein [Colwellia piezophila]|uniref:ligand-binding sensor domain-containing protein n=1 Tax=Colwellia piezophila TaxID=211668 RepID=UPI00036648C5|nr:two-component regulator propeller domain-containing protein [Colwellia piezophila]
MKKLYLVLFLSLLSYMVSAKQVKLFKNFGHDNPLSYQFVRAIVQDQDDFIWFGSHEGLHRFDGYQFMSFHHDALLDNSLSSDVISKILIDSNQRFWIATSGGGLNLYRESSQDFEHFSSETIGLTLTNDVINALFEDSEGKLWIGTEHGLNILTKENDQWVIKQIVQQLGNENSLTHNTIHDVLETKNNEIWVATNGGGISVFSLQGEFIRAIKFGDSNSSNYSNKFVNSLFQDDKNNIWIGTVDNGLLKYNLKTKQLRNFKFDEKDATSIVSNTIKTIYQDSKRQLWIATDKGLLIYQEKSENFQRYNHSASDPYSLSNDFILCFFEDKNNMMWIGTFTGVNRLDPNMATFSQYSVITHPELANSNITSFSQLDDKSILFSSYSGGIYLLSLETNDVQRLELNDFFSKLRVMKLYVDKQTNKLWVGTRTSGLYLVNLKTKHITSYKNDANNSSSISANSITDILKDKQGNLWVSTFHQGLNRLNNDEGFTRFIKHNGQPELGPSSNHVLQLLEDNQGFIWIGTYGGGLNRFNPTTGNFIHFKHDKNDASTISSDTAWVMLQDKSNNLWVGTQAAGLNLLTYKNMQKEQFSFQHFDTKDGMKSRTVYGLTQDNLGDIWFSSNKGISRLEPNNQRFKHFDLSHGLVDLEYNHNSFLSGLDNTIYFGAGKGFSSVIPDKIKNNVQAPNVRLTNILKLNEAMTFDVPLAQLASLTLKHSDQLISFEYVGLNYATPDSTRYKYRLLGFDQEWIDAGKLRRATYTNLPQGSYQLQIIAGNSDNLWSESYKLDITMNPAPWNTWWAYILYAALIALLLLAYSRFLNRKLLIEQQQKEYLKQQVKEKTAEFHLKNVELEQANLQLEDAATVDKVTGVKSRRYLDIYIEQASQLMSQIHENILPVQRSLLPRLYLLMIKLDNIEKITNSQLVNLTDLLLYSRNNDDLVIRWADDTFMIIGYEKDNNTRDLVTRLTSRFEQVLGHNIKADMAYAFYPFNFEQPMALSWDQVSVLTEHALKVARNNQLSWLGFHAPKVQPFNYLDVIQQQDIAELSKLVKLKQG